MYLPVTSNLGILTYGLYSSYLVVGNFRLLKMFFFRASSYSLNNAYKRCRILIMCAFKKKNLFQRISFLFTNKAFWCFFQLKAEGGKMRNFCYYHKYIGFSSFFLFFHFFFYVYLDIFYMRESVLQGNSEITTIERIKCVKTPRTINIKKKSL